MFINVGKCTCMFVKIFVCICMFIYVGICVCKFSQKGHRVEGVAGDVTNNRVSMLAELVNH